MRAEAVQPQHMVLWKTAEDICSTKREINDNKMQLFWLYSFVSNYVIITLYSQLHVHFKRGVI